MFKCRPASLAPMLSFAVAPGFIDNSPLGFGIWGLLGSIGTYLDLGLLSLAHSITQPQAEFPLLRRAKSACPLQMSIN